MEEKRNAEIAGRRSRELQRVSLYAAQVLLPALGSAGEPFDLATPATGLRSLVYFVRPRSAPPMVLRLVERRADARWLAAAIDIFRAHDLPAPRPLYRDLSIGTWWRRGWAAFAEELVEGRPLEPGTLVAALEDLGRAYGRVHSVMSSRWDRPHAQRQGDIVAEWVRRAAKLVREACRGAPGPFVRQLHERFERIRSARPLPPRVHSLCHGRVTATNVLIRPHGPPVLIDLERVKYGSHLHELAVWKEEVLRGSGEAFERFLSGYRGAARPELDPTADPGAWRWHLALIDLRRTRDAAAAGDFEAAFTEL